MAGAPARADPITLNFQGSVSQVVFDPFDPLGGAVAPGSALHTYLNFDTTAVDAAPSPLLGSYTLSGGTHGLAAVVGPVPFPVMHAVNISVVDGGGGGPDQYSVFAWEGTAGGLGDYFSFSMLLQDDSGTAITGDALPATAPDINRFVLRGFTLSGQYTDADGNFIQYELQGDIAPAAAPMPEPRGLGLLGLALLACTLAARRDTQRDTRRARVPERATFDG